MADPEKLINQQDIVVISTQDWDALPTRKHRFARKFAQNGNRVLYIEQQMHWAGWLWDIKNQFNRAWRWLSGPREVEPGLWVFTLPIVFPFFQMSGLINRINNFFLLPIIRRQVKKLGFQNSWMITYTPHSADFIGKLEEQIAIYECVDDFTASKGLVDAQVIERLERQLIEKVDLLVTTHASLLEKKQDGAEKAILISNGVDADHFSQAANDNLPVAAAMADLKHPVIGYLGGINYWIDNELLARIARKHPDWTVALVGPAAILANLKPLEGLDNVVMTGRVPYQEVPQYVKAFDVCVNPYVLDEVAEHCSPLKLYEYIATGKPVVSVDMPEAHRFGDLVAIAKNADDFILLVEKAVETGDNRGQERMELAHQHTWDNRFETLVGAIREITSRKMP